MKYLKFDIEQIRGQKMQCATDVTIFSISSEYLTQSVHILKYWIKINLRVQVLWHIQVSNQNIDLYWSEETIVFGWITLITWKIVEGESIRTVEFAHLGDCWLHCFLLMLETNRPRSMDMEMKNVRKPPLSPASVKACIKWIDQAWIMIIQIISWK